MIRIAIVTLLALLGSAQSASGVAGCVTPAADLAARSDVVVIGRVEGVEHMALVPCPVADAVANERYAPAYKKCGDTLVYVLSVTERLRGEAPAAIIVHVAFPDPLTLTCDDRPAPEEMAGVYGTFFLEEIGRALWLVDGPDGIHVTGKHPSRSEAAAMRRLVEAHPRQKGAVHGR